MQVIATLRGYDNIRVREPGEEFEMPDDATGSWFEPVGGAKPKAKPEGKAKAGKEPRTMSEAAKGDTSEVQADLA